MSDDELGRVQRDLDVMQRAMGLRLPFGSSMLLVTALLALVAATAAFVSLMIEVDWLQHAIFAGIAVLISAGMYFGRRQQSQEITAQVLLSATIYVVVWVSASAYMLANVVGPALGTTRAALLNVAGFILLLGFTFILVRAAFRSREQLYCLGLALSLVLAGMLLPIFGADRAYSLAHAVIAVGCLASLVIQWVQLREAVPTHGAH